MKFTKMHGCGNDFIVMLEQTEQSKPPSPAMIRHMADRRHGIGFDQLLWLTTTTDVQRYGLRIFNADGGEAEQCGNGLRCIACYLQTYKTYNETDWIIQTKAGACRVGPFGSSQYKANLGAPVFSPDAIPFIATSQAQLYRFDSPWGKIEVGVVSFGNPHAVIRVPTLSIEHYQAQVRFIADSTRFPQGVNVGLCQVINASTLDLKVFERGSGWTEACGSGAAASVVVAKVNHWLSADQINVNQPGGNLKVQWSGGDQALTVIGDAQITYDGQWLCYELASF